MTTGLIRWWNLAGLLALMASPSAAAPAVDQTATDAEQLFVRRVQPLLSGRCGSCHGLKDVIEGGLVLTDRAGLLQPGDSGRAAVVPGEPTASPLLQAIGREDDEYSAMPPKESERLTAEEVGWLSRWIEAGAPWPDAERVAEISRQFEQQWSVEDGVRVVTSGGLSADWDQRRYDPESLWAYQPLAKPSAPMAPPGTHPIDAFLLARLPAGLAVAPPADRRTLLRRVSFDLIGLPPTPAELEAFLTDPRDDAAAFAAVVDRLLASPHYGERMAQHWLDVVRYADSSGFANDYERGNAWRYRDYLVRAFNTDKPFNEFVREQLAGDELDSHDPEKLVATGFLRMGPWELTGMEVAKVARQRFLDDVTNSVGETFLAHSLRCARCHDHKFDPVPTRDYYAIQAVFATTQLAERAAAFLPEENTNGFAERRYLEARLADYHETLQQIDRQQLAAAAAWFQDHDGDAARWDEAVASVSKQELAGGIFAATRRRMLAAKLPEDLFPPRNVGLSPAEMKLERVARKGIERLRWSLDRYEPYALAVYSGPTPDRKRVSEPVRLPVKAAGSVEQTCILAGGDPFSPAEPVSPGVLSACGDIAKAIPESVSGRRQAFADWVAADENPLTPRVIVNRIWLWHFGEPLAGNPNNFGTTGKRPTHPLLLDWLAARLVESGWSLKAIHREILQTAAYRRSSRHPSPDRLRELDPAGIGLAAFRPRRLSAEELRDAMLAASGELILIVGGIPNRPEIHPDVAFQPRQVMGSVAAAWTANPLPEQRHRRSLYSLKLRGLSDPAMEVFNRPGPDFSCERRETSTVTPQVFTLFNSQASLLRSLALAADVLDRVQPQSDQDAIRECFLRVLSRRPTNEELAHCLDHWRHLEQLEAAASYSRQIPPLTLERTVIEEMTGEVVSFDERLHAHDDFVPDLQPADCDARTRGLANLCLVLFNSNEFVTID